MLTLLGHLALRKGELTAARQRFVDALQLACRFDLWGHALAALAGLAAFFAAADEPQRSFLLAQLVVDHRASNYTTRQRASHLIEQTRLQICAAEAAAIAARLQTTPFDVVVAELLSHREWQRHVNE